MVNDHLSRIQDKLLRLKQMDDGLSFFGAESHRYELNPRASESVVTTFEDKFGVTLPEEYRAFLLRIGDGGAGPYYGLYALRHSYEEMGWIEPGDIRKPFPLDRSWNEDGEPEECYDLPAEANVRDGCIMLSHHGCGYWSFLVVTGGERGKVWNDFTTADGGLHPTGKGFVEWYEWWLDMGLRREMWF